MAFIIMFMILFLFWIVMSGRFDGFHLALGVISSAIVSYISHDLFFKDIKNRYRHIEAALRIADEEREKKRSQEYWAERDHSKGWERDR